MHEHAVEGLLQHLDGAEVHVVALRLVGEEAVQGVVDVVGPLGIHALGLRHGADGGDHGRLVQVRLRNQHQRATHLEFPVRH